MNCIMYINIRVVDCVVSGVSAYRNNEGKLLCLQYFIYYSMYTCIMFITLLIYIAIGGGL